MSGEITMSEQMQAGVVGDLASAANEMYRALAANTKLDFDRAVALWVEIGDALLHYGARRKLDVSAITEMVERMGGRT